MYLRTVGYAPLLPVAAAASTGIVIDRFMSVGFATWCVVAGLGIVGWLAAFRRGELLALGSIWLCAAGLAGAYHHSWRHHYPADDIGNFAAIEAKLVRVRGSLADEPVTRPAARPDPLRSRPRPESTSTELALSEVQIGSSWQRVSGRVRLSVDGVLNNLHVGDEVEVTGWLTQPTSPLNPGEPDFADNLRDERIRATLRVADSPAGVVRLAAGPWGLRRLLAEIRNWGQRGINERLQPPESSIASALLLGDTTAMSADEWDQFVRTGVIHVLAISGQHLVILGAFFWFVLRLCGVRRRTAATLVAALLLAYALLTGGRPSAMRAAVIAGTMCAGILLRRPTLPANSLSLAWLIVLALNPTDLFTAGFQLSFLCVAVLFWGIPRWFPPHEPTPLEILIDESRSLPERALRQLARWIGRAYLVTLMLGIATAPLIAYWQNLIAPAGVVIGPPAILLTAFALIAGFLLILVWPIGPLALPVAWVASKSLSLCTWLVDVAEKAPGGCWHVGHFPIWWVIGFYAIGILWMFGSAPEPARTLPQYFRARTFPIVLGLWSVAGLALSFARPLPDELRVTVLAVEHGLCTVIEAPDGRVLLYDAGALGGPEVTKRRIAPFLWTRGIRRIDEVFLSHADLDHFNGLPALLERFHIGQITLTPSFADKPSGGVRRALEALEARGVAVRATRAGDHFAAGDVSFAVLHPPGDGPAGVENVRSLVLLITRNEHTILLTGDLEGAGLDRVLRQNIPAIDVLLAPHHGAPARADALAEWARPRLVISSQGRGDAGKAAVIYERRGIPYWSTWPDGAITLRSHNSGLIAESYSTGKRHVVRTR